MSANALQLPYQRRMPPRGDQVSSVSRIGNLVYFESGPLSEGTAEHLWDANERTHSGAFVFLLIMAAISLVREIGALLLSALWAWFGVTVHPFLLALVLQLVVTFIGVRVASRLSPATPGSSVRRHMLVTLGMALGIGLILALLGHLVGHTNALSWLLIPVYLLWACAEAVSGPVMPMKSA
jgi:hypothetical protein